MRIIAAAFLVTAGLAACSTEAEGPALPPAEGSFDYQLGGSYDGEFRTVARDSMDEPLPGAYSICYVNGFQTQPGSEWDEALLLRDSDGGLVVDPAWPDEHILDTRSADNRRAIVDVIGQSIDLCATKGFDAVEIDNLDAWARFAELDEDSTLQVASAYSDRAHDAGMAIAQKNAPDGAETIRSTVGFNFAVTEECVAFDECAAYTDVYGSAVLDIEYTDELAESFENLCARHDRPSTTILRDRDLTTPEDGDYTYEQC